MLDVRVLEDPDAFVALGEPILAVAPAEHTIIATTCHNARTGARAFPGARWIVVQHGPRVVGLAMWTPPFEPYLGPMPHEAAVAVAAVLAKVPDPVDGINGEAEAVRTAVSAYRAQRPEVREKRTMRMRLFELGRLVPPSAPGAPRTATADDHDLLLRWHYAFADDAGLPGSGIEDGMRVRLERGALLLWEADGQPVSMAGHTDAVVGVARVGAVYTPPEHRNHGYGSAATAEASRRAGAGGARSVVLFTDLANPTSNHIYTAIGYRGVRDYTEVVFA